MVIATWNIERLKHKKELAQIKGICESLQADILVLTESDDRLHLNYRHCFHTPTPAAIYLPQYRSTLRYAETEHRVSLYTNYECIRQHPTFDRHTTLCVELKTERGHVLVYGTIMGVFGNRDATFIKNLSKQAEDFRRLTSAGYPICICGDFNCSFADNYYFTKEGRTAILRALAGNHITLLTGKKPSCIDHIAVSDSFLTDANIQIKEWNHEKTLSDHKGILVKI